ncbi:MAG: iron-sulfur cluster assembly protein [Candidatus Krumholzibacteria bacterium]|nr:iron-sulfur cluster assembly protein [Candidatus Krumholzibacteria bacterium]
MGDETVDKHEDLRQRIIGVLKTVYDPEIPVDIYELGLVYDIVIDDKSNARIVMTLTSPGCPVAVSLPVEVENKIRTVDGVGDVAVDVVWEPPWTPDRMSEAARLELNM